MQVPYAKTDRNLWKHRFFIWRACRNALPTTKVEKLFRQAIVESHAWLWSMWAFIADFWSSHYTCFFSFGINAIFLTPVIWNGMSCLLLYFWNRKNMEVSGNQVTKTSDQLSFTGQCLVSGLTENSPSWRHFCCWNLDIRILKNYWDCLANDI